MRSQTPAPQPSEQRAAATGRAGSPLLGRVRTVRPSWAVPLLAIAIAVIIANLGELSHLVTANPLVLDAFLTPRVPAGVLPGLPYIDPNAGFTTQALGHLVAMDWLHGHVPWWNPFEGIGSPLAGEMQSGAFFPPTLLLALRDGLLYLQLLLEVTAGWATYFLARRLGVGRTVSTAAGTAFALCGTFAWFAHAPFRPVAFLPLALLGVERAREAAAEGRRGGWRLLAVALALSILAGFPETAFIDGLLVALWAALRAVDRDRPALRPYVTRLFTAAAVGGALAAPLLVAFVTYLPSAYVGPHSGGLAHVSLPASGLPQVLLPYSLGPIFAFSTPGAVDTLGSIWGNVGGFLSATLVAGGLVGLVGQRHRTLRVGLGAWVAVCVLRTYGLKPLVNVMADVPGIRLTAFYRYANPSWELAVVVLAALGLDDLARNHTRPRAMVAAASITGMLSIWAAFTAWSLLTHATGSTSTSTASRHVYVVASLAGALLVLVVLAKGAMWTGRRGRGPRTERARRRGRVVMAGAVAVEGIALFGFTAFSAPAPTGLVTGSVAYLQAHLGNGRFTTLGPIQPDYGSYFGIGQLDVNDLPIPKAFTEYFRAHLDSNTPIGILDPSDLASRSGPSAATELTRNLGNYEDAGVRYVVESASGTDGQGNPWPPPGTAPWPAGPRLVEHDRLAEVWELPDPSPIFTVGSLRSVPPDCTVKGHGTDAATVTCAKPALLVRRVQDFPGWSATVNGHAAVLRADPSAPTGLFQQVAIPAGTSDVRFSFLPPFEYPASWLALVALLALFVPTVWARVERTRGASSTMQPPGSSSRRVART